MSETLSDAAPGVTTAAGALHALLRENSPSGTSRAAVPTGFQPLDQELNGGLLPGTLTLLGGAPGSGKTITALQWARNIAITGRRCMYACYEHDDRELLLRLLALEAAALAEPEDSAKADVTRALRRIASGERELSALIDAEPLLATAYERVRSYGDNLWFLRASGTYHGVDELDGIIAAAPEQPAVLVVDYLQKMSVRPEPPDEAGKVTVIAEALKELALARRLPILAIVAADRASLDAARLRLHHLRGSSALAYESDVVILLNDKRRVVSKAHLAYDTVRAESYSHYVVFTVEKNRHGAAMLDMEFRKDFASYRFEPRGRFVAERLVDERINEE